MLERHLTYTGVETPFPCLRITLTFPVQFWSSFLFRLGVLFTNSSVRKRRRVIQKIRLKRRKNNAHCFLVRGTTTSSCIRRSCSINPKLQGQYCLPEARFWTRRNWLFDLKSLFHKMFFLCLNQHEFLPGKLREFGNFSHFSSNRKRAREKKSTFQYHAGLISSFLTEWVISTAAIFFQRNFTTKFSSLSIEAEKISSKLLNYDTCWGWETFHSSIFGWKSDPKMDSLILTELFVSSTHRVSWQ